MTLTPNYLALTSFRIEPTLQPRVGGLDEAHVRVLEEAPASWPPLAVVRQGEQFILVDGFHRFAAAQNLGLTTVPVRIVPVPDDGDLHALAFALNAVHGRPLTLPDRRAFAERLLRQHAELANMEIARRAGLSPTTVATIRERLGTDGTRYPVRATSSQRQTGELPDVGIGALIGETAGRLFTSAERRAQRRLAQYLQRLAVALEDQAHLASWETAAEAADTCRLVLGAERATDLGERLGWTSRNVLDVAVALGYADAESEE